MKVLSEAAEKRLVVEIEYLKEGEESPSPRRVEPYTIERELPVWRVHTWIRRWTPRVRSASTECGLPR